MILLGIAIILALIVSALSGMVKDNSVTIATQTVKRHRAHSILRKIGVDSNGDGIDVLDVIKEIADIESRKVYNGTGNSIAAGKLVYLSGYDSTTSCDKITLASNASNLTLAQAVALETIADGSTGYVGRQYTLTSQNTDAVSVGAPVYLSTGGAVTTSKPTTTATVQIVGRTFVKHASTGKIDILIEGVDRNHTHASVAEGGQLDWDDIWADAAHDHSAAGEGGAVPEASVTMSGTGHAHTGTTGGAKVDNHNLRIPITNQTGSGYPLAAGDLLTITGYSGGKYTVLKAQANATTTLAILVADGTVADGASGTASLTYLFAANTAAGAVGDPVYLSAATAGLWTLTKPATVNYVQQVGRVAVANASGQIEFNLPGTYLIAHDHGSASGGGAVPEAGVTYSGTGHAHTGTTGGALISDYSLRIPAKKTSGGNIADGELVYISGYSSGVITVEKAQANAAATLAQAVAIGAITSGGAAGTIGFQYAFTADTSASASVGVPVYLDAASAGAWTITKPSGANFVQLVGYVSVDHTTGKIEFLLPGCQIQVHTHADNANGGAVPEAGVTFAGTGHAHTGTTGGSVVDNHSLRIPITNQAGSGYSLAAGQLLTVKGYAGGKYTVLKAQANAATTMAALVADGTVADGASGTATLTYLLAADTALGAVGDPVYLSAASAGAWTLTKPATVNFPQVVGRIAVANASGQIEFTLPGQILQPHDHANASGGGAVPEAGVTFSGTGHKHTGTTDGALLAHFCTKAIPLYSAIETDGTNVVGFLGVATTPKLDMFNADTDSSLDIEWAAANVDPILFEVDVTDIDNAGDVVISFYGLMAGAVDAPSMTMDAYFDKGDTKISASSATTITNAGAVKTITIAAADVKASANKLTFELTPEAHGTDALYFSDLKIKYKKLQLGTAA
jgi:hypothetical protein